MTDRPALPPFPDMLSATPILEWIPEIDEPVEIFVEHANLRYADAADADRWRGWFPARWIDHNGGGWTWRGMIGTVTHVRPIVPEGVKMNQDQKLMRAEFYSRLREIDTRIDAARTAAKPYRDALQPFEDALETIIDERAEFIEKQEELGVFDSRCIGCGAPLFDGDMVCREDDEGYDCAECAPTLAEALENNRIALQHEPDNSDLIQSVASIEARIKAEGPDAKLVYPR